MLKHVGKHNSKKIVLLYRTVPNEDHMCLLTYSDVLPSSYHDTVMRVLESASGQQAGNLADELHRNLLPDGRNILNTLHKEGMIKKVPTNQVIITPTTNSNVRLDELNSILSDMEQGEDAVRKMAEIDSHQGVRDVGKKQNDLHVRASEFAESATPPSAATIVPGTGADGVLSDTDLARMSLEQATSIAAQAESLKTEASSMAAQAESLKTEASRLTEEAYTMDPSLRPVVKKAPAKKATVKKATVKKATVKKATTKKVAVKKAESQTDET